MIAVFCAYASVLSPVEKIPSWVDVTLAGYVVDHDESHPTVAIYDSKTGFMIVRTAECDGGSLNLLLTRDRKLVSEMGYIVPGLPENDRTQKVVVKALLPLVTSKGIRIGDSERRVRGILGSPTSTKREGSQKQFHVFDYLWSSKHRADPLTYEQTYTFKENRLIEIRFGKYMGG